MFVFRFLQTFIQLFVEDLNVSLSLLKRARKAQSWLFSSKFGSTNNGLNWAHKFGTQFIILAMTTKEVHLHF